LIYNFQALPGAEISNAMLRHLSKPIRTVVLWQFAATAALALAAALLAGSHGAISAAAGGAISIVAGVIAALVAAWSGGKSAGGVVLGALRAEAVKIGLAILLLWLVLTNYERAVAIALVGSFVVTTAIFAMAFFVRDY
jgi:ATP synthase protein I